MEWVLSLVILGQFLFHWWSFRFWAKQVDMLTEKLMSRDITEYKAATTPQVPRVQVNEQGPLEDFGSLPNFTL